MNAGNNQMNGIIKRNDQLVIKEILAKHEDSNLRSEAAREKIADEILDKIYLSRAKNNDGCQAGRIE